MYSVVLVNITIKQVPISNLRNGNLGSEEIQKKLLSSLAFQKHVMCLTQNSTEAVAKKKEKKSQIDLFQ